MNRMMVAVGLMVTLACGVEQQQTVSKSEQDLAASNCFEQALSGAGDMTQLLADLDACIQSSVPAWAPPTVAPDAGRPSWGGGGGGSWRDAGLGGGSWGSGGGGFDGGFNWSGGASGIGAQCDSSCGCPSGLVCENPLARTCPSMAARCLPAGP